jgi:hypothetical protein
MLLAVSTTLHINTFYMIQLKRFIGIISIFLLVASCRVSLVPEYSKEIETQITNGAKLNDKLYIDLLNAPLEKRGFDVFSARYSEVEAEINSIRLKNEIRKQNVDMLKIIDNLANGFKGIKEEHKNKKSPLTDGEITVYQATLKGYWKPLLIAEGGLKKVKKPTVLNQ